MTYQVTEADKEAMGEAHEAIDGFMRPKFYLGADITDALMESGLDAEDDAIYCRLSADGYMDCTDWHGPFNSVVDAADALIELYAIQ